MNAGQADGEGVFNGKLGVLAHLLRRPLRHGNKVLCGVDEDAGGLSRCIAQNFASRDGLREASAKMRLGEFEGTG